jgi:ABC-type microcin C transport system duplicated ATPase subunit YejF
MIFDSQGFVTMAWWMAVFPGAAIFVIVLACDPELLIADEPTTSLDVTTHAQIIELVRDLQQEFGTAVVWIRQVDCACRRS